MRFIKATKIPVISTGGRNPIYKQIPVISTTERRRNPTHSSATQFNHVQSQSSPPRLLRYDKKKIFVISTTDREEKSHVQAKPVISTTLPGMQAIGRNKSSPRIHSWEKQIKSLPSNRFIGF